MTAINNGAQNGLYSYDSFNGNNNKSGFRFLWWCSGANQTILEKYPSEHIKYSGLGGVLLATFVLAAFSSGYAFYSVFDNLFTALVFALIWGLIIFNFDRFLVSTMRKYGISTRKQIWMALPRVILAVLIGFTIARPLELKIFEMEVNIKVADNMHQKILKNDSMLQLETNASLLSASSERDRLLARKSMLEDTLHRLQQSYVTEADGTGGSGRRGIESLTRLKMDAHASAMKQYEPELKKLGSDIALQDSIIGTARAGMEIKRKEYETSLLNNVGFLERNKALSDLESEESSVMWTCLMISLLIIIIETAPIISKLIMPAGPYDIAIAKEELLHMAESENQIRKDKLIVFEKRKKLYALQQEISEELMQHTAEIQRKHIKETLEKWEKGESTVPNQKQSLDEVMKEIRQQYDYSEENLL